MSLIALGTKWAPSQGLPLLDARVAGRKSCGLGSRDTKGEKWSKIEERFTEVLQDAYQNVDGANDVMSDPHRFTPPLPSIRAVPEALAKKPRLPVSNGKVEWTASHALEFFRLTKKNTDIMSAGSAMVIRNNQESLNCVALVASPTSDPDLFASTDASMMGLNLTLLRNTGVGRV